MPAALAGRATGAARRAVAAVASQRPHAGPARTPTRPPARRAGSAPGTRPAGRCITIASAVEGPARPVHPAAASPEKKTDAPTDRAALSSASASTADPRFTLVRIPGDGSCLFRALAQGNHALANGGALLDKAGLLAAGFTLRRAVCAALVARRAEVEPFLDCPFPAYVDKMSLEGTWGGEPELAVAPYALQRAVCVYEATARGPLGGVAALRKTSAYGADAFPSVPPVCVLFSGAHYDLLLQQQ